MAESQTLPFAPAQGTTLCALAEIPNQGAKEVVFGEGHDCLRILLLRAGGDIHAYRNCCAHFHIPLNYEPGVFHVLDCRVLMCAHHGAMYGIADGVCFDGPCKGESLQKIPIAIVEDQVVLI
jgi:nitrite reductase/ring-hydroxylating ferredoxin subunit